MMRLPGEVAEEPVPGQPGGHVEGARLLEQVAGAGHHGQAVLAVQFGLGAAVEVQYHLIVAADDQQHWRGHGRQPGAGPDRGGRRGTPRPQC